MPKIQMDATVHACQLKKRHTVLNHPVHGISRRQVAAALGKSNWKWAGSKAWIGRVDGRPFMLREDDPGSVRLPKEWAFCARRGNKWVIGEVLST